MTRRLLCIVLGLGYAMAAEAGGMLLSCDGSVGGFLE